MRWRGDKQIVEVAGETRNFTFILNGNYSVMVQRALVSIPGPEFIQGTYLSSLRKGHHFYQMLLFVRTLLFFNKFYKVTGYFIVEIRLK